MGYRRIFSKWEVYSNRILLQEIRKSSNTQSNFTSKSAGKRRSRTTTEKKKNKVSRRKEIKIRAEIIKKRNEGRKD